MSKPRRHDRAPDQTQITVSLPKSLLDEINAFAKADNRPRSNWIVTELARIVAQKLAEKTAEARAISALTVVPSSASTARIILNEEPPAPPRGPRMTGARKVLRALKPKPKT